jgi:hypothetical protein
VGYFEKALRSGPTNSNWMGWQFGTFFEIFEDMVAHFDAFVADIGGARWAGYEICNYRLAFLAEGAFQGIGISGTLVLSHGRIDSIKRVTYAARSNPARRLPVAPQGLILPTGDL